MESLNQIICEKRLRSKGLISPLQHIPKPTALGLVRANNSCRALVQASLQTVFGRKGRHMTGTFCLTGDTMEGIIQCLVFLKAFSVSFPLERITFCFKMPPKNHRKPRESVPAHLF